MCVGLSSPCCESGSIILTLPGTLTRCIDSLEHQDKEASVSNGSSKDNHSATSALKKILNTAYLINIQVSPGNAFLRSFLDKMKQVHNFCYVVFPDTSSTALLLLGNSILICSLFQSSNNACMFYSQIVIYILLQVFKAHTFYQYVCIVILFICLHVIMEKTKIT